MEQLVKQVFPTHSLRLHMYGNFAKSVHNQPTK